MTATAISEVRWGLVGTGGWAEKTFAPAIAAADGARLVAVLSRDPARAAAFAADHGARGFSDLDAFVADEMIDVIWIASPHGEHAVAARAALVAGKAVLCEKPLALTVTAGEEVVAASRAAGRLLGVGTVLRHHPLLARLAADWQAGAFGAPVFVRTHLFHAFSAPPRPWRRERVKAGGWALYDIAIHLVNLVRWFLGPGLELASHRLGSPRFGYETDDLTLLTLHAPGGASGVVEASTGAGGPGPKLEIYGTEAWAIVEGALFGRPGRLTTGGLGRPSIEQEAPAVDLYRLEVEAFGRALRLGEPFAATGHDALEDLRLLVPLTGLEES